MSVYAYRNSVKTFAHGYLRPVVERLVSAHAAGRRLRVFEIGCGNGEFADFLSKLGHEACGTDLSPEGIAIARKAFPHNRYAVADVSDPRAESFGGGFDLVVSLEVIEHLTAPRDLLRYAARSMKPGGRLIVSTPYHGYLKNLALSLLGKWDSHHAVHWDGGHVKFFSVRTLAKMLEAEGFRVEGFHFAGRAPFLWKSMVCIASLEGRT